MCQNATEADTPMISEDDKIIGKYIDDNSNEEDNSTFSDSKSNSSNTLFKRKLIRRTASQENL